MRAYLGGIRSTPESHCLPQVYACDEPCVVACTERDNRCDVLGSAGPVEGKGSVLPLLNLCKIQSSREVEVGRVPYDLSRHDPLKFLRVSTSSLEWSG